MKKGDGKMTKEKLTLPGEHLNSYEEAEPGDNAYSANDEVYSAGFGIKQENSAERKVDIVTKRKLEKPVPGMEVYCLITKTSPNNAMALCVAKTEIEGHGRGLGMDAVLSVSEIREGFVKDLRDEIKIGDIIKAKVSSITKTGIEISMKDYSSGVVKAFCPKCRGMMELQDNIFVCKCRWKERKKLPNVDQPERSERFERRSSFGEGRGERRPYPRRDGERRDFRREKRY